MSTDQTGAPPAPVSSDPGGGPVDLGTGPIAAVTVAVPAGPDVAAQALAMGFDEPTAELIALTESTVAVVDVHTFVVRHEFPTGAAADVSYRLVAASDMSPGDPPTFSGGVVGDEYHVTMQYAISASELPADLLAQVGDALPAAPSGLRSPVDATIAAAPNGLRSGPPTAPTTRSAFGPRLGAGTSGVIGVIVTAELSQGLEGVGDEFADHLTSKGYDKAGTSWEAIKAGKKVWEALEANEIIAKALQELAVIRECAQNPTNPLTQKAYRDNPQEQQNVLDQLTEIEIDIKTNAVVMFTSMMADTAGGLVKAAPWLGFITAPGNNFVQETLTALVKNRVGEARRRADCTPVKYIASGGGGISITGTIDDVSKAFTLQGSGGGQVIDFEFAPSGPTGGTLTYSGSGGGAGLEGSGTYTISQSGGGTLALAFTTGGCADIGTCRENSGTITLTPVED